MSTIRVKILSFIGNHLAPLRAISFSSLVIATKGGNIILALTNKNSIATKRVKND